MAKNLGVWGKRETLEFRITESPFDCNKPEQNCELEVRHDGLSLESLDEPL